MSEPIPLVRKELKDGWRDTQSANPSLLMQKGFIEIENPKALKSSGEEAKKFAHLNKMAKLPAPSIYQRAFNRWFNLTSDSDHFGQRVMKLENRLLIGLSGSGALETGCSLSYGYGMPYIPGSSVKGVVRAWVEQNFKDNHPDELAELFGTRDSDDIDCVSGLVTFHDAWWIPHAKGNTKPKPFVLDVVTTHHQAYYNDKQAEPSDKDSPIPNHLLAVQGSFLFVIEGAPEHVELCQKMLTQALQDNGIGAKTAAGYGYFRGDDQEALDLLSCLQKLSRERRMSDEEKREYDVEHLTEKQLTTMFSKDLNKTKKRDDIQWLIAMVVKHHGEIIDSWKSETKKSSVNRWKAYNFLVEEQ
ncbi:type III-B CRISPR module RAMP protein Cmr6 [Vibrio spartinae]|uniref:RAMP superfamily protein n=1 Tax=Vibrio spartinae TaxID=1918945 RepID=A0A1N6MAT6_9VIBR|nr:type III-B CRISPR module RAMP protein Cmr6 [Vibrio spartinae]SIO96521.1 RAMP superfamily protein [Vibrio spartinae]